VLNVLVTGCSSGIGRATALRLHASGARVFASVRGTDDAAELESRGLVNDGRGSRVVVMDVTQGPSVDAALRQVDEVVGSAGLHALVNNAGEGFPGPLETLPIDDITAQLDVNLIGQIRVTQAALPLLRRAHGRLLFVGSIGGKVAFEFAGPYHASKYAIEAVADCWRQELAPDGITVSVVEPGPMTTGIWSKAIERLDRQLADQDPRLDRYRDRLTSFRDRLRRGDEQGSDPDDVAQVIENALRAKAPDAHYPVGLPAKIASVIRPLVPERIWDEVARRVGG
jgi:NAD(P)-dependent dehydrogenase (short-subunit alcohol dehydrogenase family)